jgi:hemerythrin
MPFTDDMSVKVKLFDSEHKKLIDLAEALAVALKSGNIRINVPDLIEDLVQYSKTHFKNEEEMMQQYNYPGYETQKKQHNEFIIKVSDMKRDYDPKNDPKVAQQTFAILQAWIGHHILKVDKEYGDFFNGKGLR